MPTTVPELAREREQAAEDFEAALVVAGAAYRDFLRVSTALSDRLGADVHQKIAVPIITLMARAGFSALLERKLVARGTPPSLRELVTKQHEEEGIASA